MAITINGLPTEAKKVPFSRFRFKFVAKYGNFPLLPFTVSGVEGWRREGVAGVREEVVAGGRGGKGGEGLEGYREWEWKRE
jgi:hypothetical protein